MDAVTRGKEVGAKRLVVQVEADVICKEAGMILVSEVLGIGMSLVGQTGLTWQGRCRTFVLDIGPRR